VVNAALAVAPSRLGTTSGFLRRHAFQALILCLSRATCSSFAMNALTNEQGFIVRGIAAFGNGGCHSPIDKSLVLPVRDVTSVLSNASCLSSFENWLEAARLSRSGVLSRAAAGPPAQPTLNRLGP
jgi:hypothetical protein